MCDQPYREPIEWCRVWLPDADRQSLEMPRVLLVGDSIVVGYGPHVATLMEGDASIAWLCTSRFPSDPVFTDEMMLALRHTRFDIVHFNNGLHGFDYGDDDYAIVLPAAVNHFRSVSCGAAWALATSTPIRLSDDLNQFGERNERVLVRNQTVRELAELEGLPITDLYAVAADHPEWFVEDAVHHNEAGQEGLAEYVVRTLRGMIAALS